MRMPSNFCLRPTPLASHLRTTSSGVCKAPSLSKQKASPMPLVVMMKEMTPRMIVSVMLLKLSQKKPGLLLPLNTVSRIVPSVEWLLKLSHSPGWLLPLVGLLSLVRLWLLKCPRDLLSAISCGWLRYALKKGVKSLTLPCATPCQVVWNLTRIYLVGSRRAARSGMAEPSL